MVLVNIAFHLKENKNHISGRSTYLWLAQFVKYICIKKKTDRYFMIEKRQHIHLKRIVLFLSINKAKSECKNLLSVGKVNEKRDV